MERPLVLVVGRDPTQRTLIRDAFEQRGVVARGASSSAEATDDLRTRPVGILVVDVETPGIDAVRLLEHVSNLQPAPVVIAVTAADDPDQAASLAERGAFDLLRRPFDDVALQVAVHKALRHRQALDELRRSRQELQSREGYHGIVGRSQPMERLRDRLEWLARQDGPVWFRGERGTGKELAARTMHRRSKRAQGTFGVLSCAELSRQNWNERLGLDDAGDPREGGGLVWAAGGAVYLDELPALAPELQADLLALLDRASVRTMDVRVLASSKTDPAALAEQGRLIDELRGRLARETIALPSLRERSGDIPLLARYFITTICEINHLPPIRLAPDALELLERYHWPENVQELRNAMEQAVILSPDGTIRPRDLPDRLRDSVTASGGAVAGEPAPLRPFREAKRDVVESFERSYLHTLMERHGGNVTAASQRAGMLRSALQRLLRKYGLKSASFRRQRAAATPEEPTRPER